MIRIDSHRTRAHTRAELGMMLSFKTVVLLLLILALSALCFGFCVSLVYNVIRYRDGFRYAVFLYLTAGIAGFVTAVAALVRFVLYFAAVIALFTAKPDMHEELFFEEEGYTARHTAKNGVTFEGRYHYSAVKKVTTYKEFIKIESPDHSSTFRLSDITEGTADELMAVLAGKLGDRVKHK